MAVDPNPLQRAQGKLGPNSQAGGGPRFRYVEYIGKDGQGGPTGSWQRGQTTMSTVIETTGFLGAVNDNNPNARAMAMQQAFVNLQAAILGYSATVTNNDGQGMRMVRYLPQKCPYAPWLYAESITNVRGVNFVGKGVLNGGNISCYEHVRMIVGYTSRPYRVVSDFDLAKRFRGDESCRFVEKHPKPTAEYIMVDRGQLKFAEGPPGNPGPLVGQPLSGQAIPMGLGFAVAKADLEWTWYAVPEIYLFSDTQLLPGSQYDAGEPTNIVAGLGRVNAKDVWGYTAGTLLCLPPELTPVEQPVPPSYLGLTDEDQPRAWNVRFRFKVWDQKGRAGGDTRGHNLAYWPTTGKFYKITSIDGTQTPYAPYDFNKFFQPADPTLSLPCIPPNWGK